MSEDASSDEVRKSTQDRHRNIDYVLATDPKFRGPIALRKHN